MSYAAQCLMCQHAKRGVRHVAAPRSISQLRRVPIPTGCNRFIEEQQTALTDVVASMLFRDAGKGRCTQFTALELHPDAYFAQDAP